MKKIFLVMAIFFSLDSWSEQNSKLAIENAMRVLDSFMHSLSMQEIWSNLVGDS